MVVSGPEDGTATLVAIPRSVWGAWRAEGEITITITCIFVDINVTIKTGRVKTKNQKGEKITKQ